MGKLNPNMKVSDYDTWGDCQKFYIDWDGMEVFVTWDNKQRIIIDSSFTAGTQSYKKLKKFCLESGLFDAP